MQKEEITIIFGLLKTDSLGYVYMYSVVRAHIYK